MLKFFELANISCMKTFYIMCEKLFMSAVLKKNIFLFFQMMKKKLKMIRCLQEGDLERLVMFIRKNFMCFVFVDVTEKCL